MKGLLIKDVRTILNNNKSFFMMAIAIVFIFAFMETPEFVIGYIAILGTMLVLGTISYDEFDNGYAFIFTLPVTRKSYVQSKYVLALVYTVVVWLVACTLLLIITSVRENVFSMTFPIGVLCGSYVLQSIMIPVQLKYGSEKSRVAIVIIMGALFGIGALAMLLLSKQGIFPEDLGAIVDNLSGLSNFIIGLVLFAVAAVIMFISYRCSIKVMENKEF